MTKQEMMDKMEQNGSLNPSMPIRWHMIGHLQTNKVKYIAGYVHLIHAIDTHKLLVEINKQAEKHNRVIDCLLQLHVAQEETKFGFAPQELLDYVKEGKWRALKNVRLCGLMCMASNVDDENQIASEFSQAEEVFNKIKSEYFLNEDYFSIRSWGMSEDYPIAIMHGSNMIRVGSKIFGPRVY